MKRMDLLLKVALCTVILLAVLTFLDFLALHDIYKDYVSQAALSLLNIQCSKELPAWTNTALEWNALTINYTLKIFVTIINILLIMIIRKTVQKRDGKNLEQP